MRILLTGASGFIGSLLLARAIKRGHSVCGLSRFSPRLPADREGSERVTWLEGSLTNAPWSAIGRFKPDTCVHGAWTTAPKFTYDSPEHFRALEESKEFLKHAIELGVKRVVGIGTCLEYRLGPAPLVENRTPLEPLGPYAESKNAMRAWLEEQAPRLGFAFSWGRLYYVYGVGEDPTRLCTSLINKLSRDESIVLKTPQSTKDYIYVVDVVSALMLLAEKSADGVFNVGSGVGITVYDLAQTLARMLNKPGLVQKAVPEISDPLGYVVADNTRLRTLGWEPEFDLDRGLQTMIASTSVSANDKSPLSKS